MVSALASGSTEAESGIKPTPSSLAGDVVLHSWGGHFTLPLSTQHSIQGKYKYYLSLHIND